MKAVQFRGVGQVRCADIDKPLPKPGEALVKIEYGGICGSDLHIYREGMFVAKLGETMGHEFSGFVVSAPQGSGFSPGDLVTGDPRRPCLSCPACARGDYHRCQSLGFIGEVSPGAFAEYLTIAPEKLVRFDGGVSPRDAVLAEPLAVAVHACRRINAKEDDTALIMGAGPIGLLIACCLKQLWKLKRVAVFDIDAFRLGKAKEAGAEPLSEDFQKAAGDFSILVDAVGAEAMLNAAFAAASPGAGIFISAIYEKTPRLDINAMVSREITVTGNNAYSFGDLQEAVRLINAGKPDLSWLVTSVLPAEEAARGFGLLTAREKKDLKILLRFGAE